ncbi:MAG: hypothetical protein VX777_00015 [Chlamydiota bacterium]|nr:hypothetical protein [Chlamydiota bacterium]
MTTHKKLWKGVPFTLFLLLFSCSKSPVMWKHSKSYGTCSEYSSSKVHYKDPTSTRPLEIELINTSDTSLLYINAHTLEFPAQKEHPDKSKVHITIDDEEIETSAYRLQGGQRLLLDDDSRKLIVDALNNNKSVTIKVGRYKTVLSPKGFKH